MQHESVKEGFMPYITAGLNQNEQEVIDKALAILQRKLRITGESLTSPNAVRDLLRLKMATLEHEVFCVLFLDSQHCLIAFEEITKGTLNQAAVYPREIIKRALHYNCAAVLLGHNHPSSNPEPSVSDKKLTETLKSALALVDVRVLDHFIVGGMKIVSFAEQGLI